MPFKGLQSKDIHTHPVDNFFSLTQFFFVLSKKYKITKMAII